MTSIAEIFKKLALAASHAAGQVFGKVEWTRPDWITSAGAILARGWHFLIADWRRITSLLALLTVAAAGTYWYKTRPKPHYLTYKLTEPGVTYYDDNGIAAIKPVTLEFSQSAAPLKNLQKAVSQGIELTPAVAGVWTWENDKYLTFRPKNDWPVNGDFTIRFDRKRFFAPGVELEEYKTTFHSAPFTAKISDSSFYQDPRDPNLKQMVATVQFSHPVDIQRFESLVSIDVAKDAEYLGLKPDSKRFTVSYDKFKLQAYLHSNPLQMPRDDTPMTLKIDKGVRAARGGNETAEKMQAVVTIPGRSSLKFTSARMFIADNARYEPEQILMFRSSSPVLERSLTGKVAVCLLPVHSPRQDKDDREPYHWTPQEIGNDILPKCQSVPLSYISQEGSGDLAHSFKFRAPVGRYLYAVVSDGVEGVGGYVSGKPSVSTVLIKPYPQKLEFLGQGALLPLTGDKKVGFVARAVDKVQVEIGRVLPSQLQHLAPQMWDFSKPGIGPDVTDTIVERFTTVRTYGDRQPGKPNYDSVDLGQYLQTKAGATRGLFLLRVRPAPQNPDDDNGDSGPGMVSDDSSEEGGGRFQPPLEDTRLILITDLGLIVKRNKDESRDVFVQSIRTGSPVDGARVDVLGVNGQPVQSAVTDANGRARLPKFANWKREKRPLVIVAEKGSDFSFMPLEARGRGLDISRFDTGGAENAESAQQLSTYLFTDRGIYRPGETTHLGLITRTADWKGNVGGLPVDLEITDSRGVMVSRTSVKLSAMAFDEVTYTSQAASPTGTYTASAILVRDEKNKQVLGTTSFKLQEFEPDRMKVRLDLSEKPIEGWLRPEDVKIRATVMHLFGDPAANRRVEGEMNLSPALPRFAKYPDYRFETAEFQKEPVHETLSAVKTDDKGIAELNPNLNRFAGRAYRLNVLARAFEAEGGRNVAAQNSAIVSPANFLVGVKPDGDTSFVQRGSARAAHWLAVNQQLMSVAQDGLTLDWVQRKYVSVLTQQNNQTWKYASRKKEIVRNTRKVKIASGGTNFVLPTQEPGDFVLILRDAAGAELNKLTYTVAGEANVAASLDRNAELQISLDKPSYLAGDTINVSIRAPYAGSGLITIERDKVYQTQWFHASTTSSVQKIQVPRDFEGNGYVSVEYVRDPSSDEIFVSPLSYGVAAFSANLGPRTESIQLTAPKEVKPGSDLVMRVVPAEASRVALIAVDEGILQVARYKNPDPLGYFFQKRMLEIDTTQILDLILPEFKKYLTLAAPGGDADGGMARHLNPFAKKRKPPVAWWSGIVDVGPAGKEFHYSVPDYYNGHLRIIAVAVTARKAGVVETGTDVKGPFILTPNVPTMAAPGDEFSVSVGVYNNLPGQGPIHVEVKPSPQLTALGSTTADFTLPFKAEGTAEFRFRANTALGSASLRFSARRGGQEAHIEDTVSVRPAVAYRTQITLGSFTSGSVTANVVRDMYPEKRTVEAAASSVPVVWGQGLVAWLEDYPYACTEQQTSKGMAALLLLSRPEFGRVRSNEAQPLAAVFSVLQSRQNDSGGMGLWASSPDTAEFATVYAAHLLVEAKERGQRISPALLGNLNGWMIRFASTPASTLDAARLRAYAVYLLVRQGIKPGPALVNVEQELAGRYDKVWPKDLAAGYLAATYRLMQRNQEAEKIMQGVPYSAQIKKFGDDDYYGATVHDAQLLYLTAKHFPGRLASVPSGVLQGIGTAATGNQMSSLSAAYALLALDSYAGAAGSGAKFGLSQIGKDGVERALLLQGIGSVQKAQVPMGAAKLKITKSGNLPGYYAVTESGFDRNTSSAAVSNGIEIFREFTDMKGNVITQAKVGEEFLVRLRLRATTKDRVSQVAVVDLLPGSVEAVLELRPPADSSTPNADPAQARQAVNSPLPIGLPAQSNWRPQYADVREDRLVLFGNVTKDAATFVYRVRAANAGVFQVPPPYAEGMYDRKVSGQGAAGKLTIVKP